MPTKRQGVADVVQERGLDREVVEDDQALEVDPAAETDQAEDDDPAAVLAVDVHRDDEGGAGEDAEQPASPGAQTPAAAAPAASASQTATPDEEVTVEGAVFKRSEVGDEKFRALQRLATNADTWRGQAAHWGKLVEERARDAERARSTAPAAQPKAPTKEQLIAAGQQHFKRLVAMGVEPEIEQELPGLAAHLGLGMQRIDRAESVLVRVVQLLAAASPEVVDAFGDLGLPEQVFEPVRPVIAQTREARQQQENAAFRQRYEGAIARLAKADPLYATLADPAVRKDFDALVVAEFQGRKDDPFAMSAERLEDELERLLLKRHKKALAQAAQAQRDAAAAKQAETTARATGGGAAGGRAATPGTRKVPFKDIQAVLDS